MRKSASDRQGELIAGLAEARQNVLNQIAALSSAERAAACIGTWSAKELLAHLIGWDFTNLRAIQEILLLGKRFKRRNRVIVPALCYNSRDKFYVT